MLVSGPNFGSGSSREHAVWALADYGFQAVIAPSFSDIFYSNSTKNGFLPVVLPREHCRGIAEAGAVRIDLDDQTVDYAGGVIRFEIEEEVKHRLLGGHDEISVTLQYGGVDRRLRAGLTRRSARPRPRCSHGVGERAATAGHQGLGRRDVRPDLDAPAAVGAMPSSTGCISAVTRPSSTPAAAAAG